MTKNPNLATTRVDADLEGRPANDTWTFPSTRAGRQADHRSVTSAERCTVPARLFWPARPIWPARRDCREHRLPSGHWVSVRQLRPDDGPALAAAVERLSALSRYRRFHSALPRLTEKMVIHLTDIDHHNHEALVAMPAGKSGIIVGVARFIRDPAHPDTAEVAVAVADSWHRRGLATLLLRQLIGRAKEEGISSLTGYILTENYPTISLVRRLGPRSMDYEGSTVTARMDLADGAADHLDDGSLRLARAAAQVVPLPLAIHVPAVIRVILDVAVELVRAVWVPQQFLDARGTSATPRREFLGTNPLPG